MISHSVVMASTGIIHIYMQFKAYDYMDASTISNLSQYNELSYIEPYSSNLCTDTIWYMQDGQSVGLHS